MTSYAEYDAEFESITEVQKYDMREDCDRTPTQSLALCRCREVKFSYSRLDEPAFRI